MKKTILILLLSLALLISWGGLSSAERKTNEELVLFDFEKDEQGWEIPDWALEKEDHVAKQVALSSQQASHGKSSLEVIADFPGGLWTAADIEIMEYFDWTPYKTISVDVGLPKTAPVGLRAKIVLTVGESWKWTEMSRSVRLKPGECTTISADLMPGSRDWRRTHPTDEFRADVRKMVVRIESNMKPVYKGSVYIDNVRLAK